VQALSLTLPLAIGFVLGILLTVLLFRLKARDAGLIARELAVQAQAEKMRDLEEILGRLKDSFASLSLDALSRNNQEFLRLANETLKAQAQAGEKDLEGKKKLIDYSLEHMARELDRVRNQVQEFEKDREQKYGELSRHLRTVTEETSRLHETADQLKTALTGAKQRGQWGERMAEDVLRVAGFVEGINYRKQKTMSDTAGRPDYTFYLPRDLVVNMDVKFPLDNYLRYLEAVSETEREKYKTQLDRKSVV
jgi:DNA recombination protein RmuC